jgi:4'-phosphopantetheinyl transferase
MDDRTIQLWLGELSANDETYPHYLQFLDQNERHQAQQYSNKTARIAYAESHARLRLLLSKILDCDPKTLRINKAEHGKPYLPDYPEFVFNISHTANKIIVAAGKSCLLGVDIETMKPRKSLSGLVDKCFAYEEQSYWRQLPEHEQTQAFYRFWTRKEALVKATGRGIALGLNTFAIDPVNPAKLLAAPEAYEPLEEWQLVDFNISATTCGALAVKTETIANGSNLNINWLTLG